jgi:hypothetical protein
VISICGDRIASVHLRGPEGWHQRPTADQIERAIHGEGAGQPMGQGLDAVAWATSSTAGERLVHVESGNDRWNLSGRDLVLACDSLGGAPKLTSTRVSHSPSPIHPSVDHVEDAAVFEALANLFEAPRAGDLVVFAADGFDFVPKGAGGHGGLSDADTRIPMIFSGAMIDSGAVLEHARLVDVTPTILGLLGKLPQTAATAFDGNDLSKELLGPPR